MKHFKRVPFDEIASTLEAIAEHHGFTTDKELAEFLGYSHSAIPKWRADNSAPAVLSHLVAPETETILLIRTSAPEALRTVLSAMKIKYQEI